MCDETEDLDMSLEGFDFKDIKESLAIAERLAQAAMITSPAAQRRLAARKLEMDFDFDFDCESEYVPPKQVLLYLVRMGSITSCSRVRNADVHDEGIINIFRRTDHASLLWKCRNIIYRAGKPEILQRKMLSIAQAVGTERKRPFLRVLQWNVLSQTLGKSVDKFVYAQPEVFAWEYRRFYMLLEIIQYKPDVICLEEVDHFRFLQSALESIGYVGKFLPKPDSPCLYLADNNGADGCAVFFLHQKFDLIAFQSKVLEVWKVKTNQVALAAIIRDRKSHMEICVVVTHLKARSGALMAKIRDEQGRDLLQWVESISIGRPLVLCGDFNAVPKEPLYKRILRHNMGLRSAYKIEGKEPIYTTWKVREGEGEVYHTIDYIFHSNDLVVLKLLELPPPHLVDIGGYPSDNYPSDHLSLVAEFAYTLDLSWREEEEKVIAVEVESEVEPDYEADNVAEEDADADVDTEFQDSETTNESENNAESDTIESNVDSGIGDNSYFNDDSSNHVNPDYNDGAGNAGDNYYDEQA